MSVTEYEKTHYASCFELAKKIQDRYSLLNEDFVKIGISISIQTLPRKAFQKFGGRN